MFDRSRFLVVHGADPKAWAERHGIEPFVGECSDCGARAETTLPFMTADLRGLKAPPCACGNENTPYCVVGAKRDILELL